jgi:hypothetical protein
VESIRVETAPGDAAPAPVVATDEGVGVIASAAPACAASARDRGALLGGHEAAAAASPADVVGTPRDGPGGSAETAGVAAGGSVVGGARDTVRDDGRDGVREPGGDGDGPAIVGGGGFE